MSCAEKGEKKVRGRGEGKSGVMMLLRKHEVENATWEQNRVEKKSRRRRTEYVQGKVIGVLQ